MPSPSPFVYVSGLISPDAVTTEVRSCRVMAAVWTVTTSLLIHRILNHTPPAMTAAPPIPIPILVHLFMYWYLGLIACAAPPPNTCITWGSPPTIRGRRLHSQAYN